MFLAAFLSWLLLASGRQAPLTPATFKTVAHFSSGTTTVTLTTAVATIEPRAGAPGYSWLRVTFYKFPLTAADVAAVRGGRIDGLEQRWQASSGRPAEYNAGHAVIQLGVDSAGKVWQIDLALPGHSCTVAASDKEAAALMQAYSFNGQRLRLTSKGTHSCEKLSWSTDVELPVFAVRQSH
jgi:hypothetical protein